MKIRLDFVTNSSSSSYVCFGVSKNSIESAIGYNGEEITDDSIISIGGYDYNEVGIEPTTFIKYFPDDKIKDIKKIVAKELNKKFGTNFTEKEISYFESGWYDG